MSTILHLLSATLAIGGLIWLWMLANRYSLRSRLRDSHPGIDCERAGCLRGCGSQPPAPDAEAGTGQSESKRSEDNAH